jgi:hypothetical protein
LPEFTGRAAIYYAPERSDPLWRLGCTWLGRDPETGEILPQPNGIAPLTSSPARYGFHATLKPPMKLSRTYDAFLADVKTLAASLHPFEMPHLQVQRISHFTALCLASPSPAFHQLADQCVKNLDAHRAPEDEPTRRQRAAGRTPRQIQNIERWGYPLVFEDWQFHMTLTSAHETPAWPGPAQSHFAPALQLSRLVREICIFVEPTPAASFRLAHRFPLG